MMNHDPDHPGMPAPGVTCPSGTCSVSLGPGGRCHADGLGPPRVLGHLSVRTEPEQIADYPERRARKPCARTPTTS
jgi:hypothetical protein